jgi:hypothetical protein
MRFMGSVNKASTLLIPVVILGYFLYLIFDSTSSAPSNQKKIVEAHLQNLKLNGKQATGLILGGSNAYYGLSAQLLMETTSINFYNLSLPAEGESDLAYNLFIQDTAKLHLNADKIKIVMYSSVLPLRSGSIKPYMAENRVNVWGDGVTPLKPQVSFASFLRRHTRTNHAEKDRIPLPLSNGDINFQTAICHQNQFDTRLGLSSVDEVVGFLKHKRDFLKSNFPKSDILLVIPSEYYGGNGLPEAWTDDLKQKFESIKSSGDSLVIQPRIPSINLLCDSWHHPNVEGRNWRTRNLVDSLDSRH